MSNVETVAVITEDAGVRVDRWFKRYYPSLKHGHLEKLLRTGQIRVDGGRGKASTRLAVDQLVRIPPVGLKSIKLGNSNTKRIKDSDREWLNNLIVYADDEIVALNKPPGIAVQGGTRVDRHIDGFLSGLVSGDRPRPKLVHRLDRDTSGVLLVALNAKVARVLGETFRGRGVEKTYWALVAGVPSPREGRIESALMKKVGKDGYEKIVKDPVMGKLAVTEYRVIENVGRSASWMSLHPQSGRTHQLRVHCADLGTPIVGDRKYGGSSSVIDGLAETHKLHLHARSITLPHPAGGTLSISAPLPVTMRATWKFFGFEARTLGDPL